MTSPLHSEPGCERVMIVEMQNTYLFTCESGGPPPVACVSTTSFVGLTGRRSGMWKSQVSADSDAPPIRLADRTTELHTLITCGAVDAGSIPAPGGNGQATRGQLVQFQHLGRIVQAAQRSKSRAVPPIPELARHGPGRWRASLAGERTAT